MSRSSRFQLISARSDTTTWRLLGGNNICLGTSALRYHDVAECVTAIAWLRTKLPSSRAEFSHSNGMKWRWLLYADNVAIATASHAYGRRIEAKHGLDRFLAAAPEAPLITSGGKVADWRKKYGVEPNSEESA